MTSLMQEFAEAKQQRLQERAVFIADCELARQEREKDLQAQSIATAEYLAVSEQTRLAWEQGRQAIAENALESRQEEIKSRSNQVAEYLQELNVTRTERSVEDNAHRAQEVRTRTFKMRSQLKHIRKARIRAAEIDLEQRLQLVRERVAFTEMQLEDMTKARLASAILASQQRAQECSDRAADVKDSLEQLEVNRLAAATAQALDLRAFRVQLKDSVWGNSDTSNQPVAIISPVPTAVKISEPAIAKPVVAKESPKELPQSLPKAPNKVEQFVMDYVAQLSTNSSLLQIVNDRDTVRDLLAQGANTLKVDPSDILNTLLQMAEGSTK